MKSGVIIYNIPAVTRFFLFYFLLGQNTGLMTIVLDLGDDFPLASGRRHPWEYTGEYQLTAVACD